MDLLEEFPTWTSTWRMRIGFLHYSKSVNPKGKSDAEKEIKAVKAFQAHIENKLVLYRRMGVEFGKSYDAALHELFDKVPHVKDLPEFDTLFSEFQKATIILELPQNNGDELTDASKTSDANKILTDPQILKELQLNLECAEEKLKMRNDGILDLLALESSARLWLVVLAKDLERNKRKRKRG